MELKIAARFFILVVITLNLLLVPFTNLTKASSAPITVKIDGETINFDQGATIIGTRTMVPMRKIFEELDSYVEWDSKTKTITATRGSKKIVLTIGSKTALVNNQKITLDVAPQIIGHRTLVPLRFISESLGAKVDWNAQTKTVLIETYHYAERYYFVNHSNLEITEVLTARQYDWQFYNHHYTEELIADEVITFYMDDLKLFYSTHTSMVLLGDFYDSVMELEGSAISGIASGEYTIYLYDRKTYDLVHEFSGTFFNIPYNRNLKTAIHRLAYLHQ